MGCRMSQPARLHHSQGGDKEEAIENIKEAIQGYIISLEDDGLPVPEENFDTFLLAV